MNKGKRQGRLARRNDDAKSVDGGGFRKGSDVEGKDSESDVISDIAYAEEGGFRKGSDVEGKDSESDVISDIAYAEEDIARVIDALFVLMENGRMKMGRLEIRWKTGSRAVW
ncbi:hypothetical protein SESBI_29681 [Sesbania bispinosa]|nr:hypothetical protein SESBI_29681 [Sesbania bispinosa]